MKIKAWAIFQKPAGYRKWILCPSTNPWIFTSKRLAESKFAEEYKKGSTDNNYHKILPVEIIFREIK